MSKLVKAGSGLLALTMAIGIQASTVAVPIIGATAFNAVTTTSAHAGKNRQIKKALKKLDKAIAAERAGDLDKAVRNYDSANRLMDKALSNGVKAGPGCDLPHVRC